jgi:uncharacterized protein (DUF427 family)
VSTRRLPCGVVRVTPAAGQESVRDNLRPPRLESSSQPVVVPGGAVTADSRPTCRPLETRHLPGNCIPIADRHPGTLVAATGVSVCEWKGAARQFGIHGGGAIAHRAARGCRNPTPAVDAREGDVSGGWVTADIVGPFTGAPGTRGW